MNTFSLVKRLWLLLIVVVLLSIGGSLIANLVNAKHYLEQQLTAQNADTANSLALMLTQYKAEPAMAETLINAAFDQGHYARIIWSNRPGQPDIQRHNDIDQSDTPFWFRYLFPLHPQMGTALVNSGWMQAGHITVESHLGYAYLSLWHSSMQTILGLLFTGLVAGALGWLDIRKIRQQLGTVVEQARAISEHRFVTIPIPAIPELANVGKAMNHMVDRLQRSLQSMKQELNKLRQEQLTDKVSNLPNRRAFEQHLLSLLQNQDNAINGHLLLIRVAGLTELNQKLGGEKTDALIKHIGEELAQEVHAHRGWLAARMRGADFALITTELHNNEAEQLAGKLCGQWYHYQSMGLTLSEQVGHIGLTNFATGESVDDILVRASQALAEAELQELNSWRLDNGSAQATEQKSEHDWKALIEHSCTNHELAIRWYQVKGRQNEVLWNEAMLFKPGTSKTPPISALKLLSHALRLNLAYQLDLSALALSLEQAPEGKIAVNISPSSLKSPEFLPGVQQLLRTIPRGRVSLELHETGLLDLWEPFLHFTTAIRAMGHRVAVEIKGHNLELVSRFPEAGVSYVVLDNTLTRHIDSDEGKKALLRGLQQMAGLMGIEIVAKGIQRAEEAETLRELGIFGLTGPAV